MLKIYYGSLLSHKIDALHLALHNLQISKADADVIPMAGKSFVRKQPEGIVEIRDGASWRATNAWSAGWIEQAKVKAHGGPSFSALDMIAIGVENGIVPLLNLPVDDPHQQYAETGICALVSKRTRLITTIAPGQMLDASDVAEARRRGFDKWTVSDVTDERTKCGTRDTTPFHTGGRVTRVDCLEIAIRIALAQYLTLTSSP